ncbi:hypothetical protein RRG08_042570 [Elysia crispata]|uniref:Uncharacterized protein n=1 Tax=Elysia crispata TaxID=231223 RepID=A0AAE0XQC9_9GAST|nr:hypothetical protein RRG08_042570 [Elysia crispata]
MTASEPGKTLRGCPLISPRRGRWRRRQALQKRPTLLAVGEGPTLPDNRERPTGTWKSPARYSVSSRFLHNPECCEVKTSGPPATLRVYLGHLRSSWHDQQQLGLNDKKRTGSLIVKIYLERSMLNCEGRKEKTRTMAWLRTENDEEGFLEMERIGTLGSGVGEGEKG